MAGAAKRSKAGKKVQEPVELQENNHIHGTVEMEGAEVMAMRLHEAIRANALNLVQDYLDAGADVNLGPALGNFVQPECDKKGNYVKNSGNATDWLVQDGKCAMPSCTSGECNRSTPLHMAICNFFWSHKKLPYSHKPAEEDEIARTAFTIFTLLINHGADVKRESHRLMFRTCFGAHSWKRVGQTWQNCTPTDLAVFLTQEASLGVSDKSLRKILNDSIHNMKEAARGAGYCNPMVQVPQSALRTWESLLFSEKFSDVRFVCAEGEVLHAHKSILAAASEYFSVLFSDRWADSNADGEVKTTNQTHIMRAILSFVYTGAMNPALLDDNSETLLSVATEYGLIELQKQAEHSCIRALDLDNVKILLKIAHLYNAQDLKGACFRFVHLHATAVLTNPEIMLLSTEEPTLWSELVSQISSKSDNAQPTSSKRTRI
jgi:hypothetical protein